LSGSEESIGFIGSLKYLNIGSKGLFSGSRGLKGLRIKNSKGLGDLEVLEVVDFEEPILSIFSRSNDILSLVEYLIIATSFNGRISIGFEIFFKVKGFLSSYSLMNGVLIIVFLVGI